MSHPPILSVPNDGRRAEHPCSKCHGDGSVVENNPEVGFRRYGCNRCLDDFGVEPVSARDVVARVIRAQSALLSDGRIYPDRRNVTVVVSPATHQVLEDDAIDNPDGYRHGLGGKPITFDGGLRVVGLPTVRDREVSNREVRLRSEVDA